MGSLEIDMIREYLLEVGCKIEYPILVRAFKNHLYNPDPNIQGKIRTQFKDFVNRLATVSLENNMKFINLRPEFIPPSMRQQHKPQPPPLPPPLQPLSEKKPSITPLKTATQTRPTQQEVVAHTRTINPSLVVAPKTVTQSMPAPPIVPPPRVAPPRTHPPRAGPPRVIQQQAVAAQNAIPPNATPIKLIPSIQTTASPASAVPLNAAPPSSLFPNRMANLSVLKQDGSDTSSLQPTIDPLKRKWAIEACCCNYNGLVTLLRENPKLASYKDVVTGYTALHWAAKFGNLEIIRLIAGQHGVSADIKSGRSGQTPLHVAYMFNRSNAARLLLGTFKANPDILDYSGKRPLQYWHSGSSNKQNGSVNCTKNYNDNSCSTLA